MANLIKQLRTAKRATRIADLPLVDKTYDPTTLAPLKAVATAKIPGVLVTRQDLRRPELKPVLANLRRLPQIGLGLYANPKTGIHAVFNPAVVKGSEIETLDAKNKLAEFLPSISSLLDAPEARSLAGSGAPVGTPETGSAPTPPAIASARAGAGLRTNAPSTRQPLPGGGLLNQLSRVVV